MTSHPQTTHQASHPIPTEHADAAIALLTRRDALDLAPMLGLAEPDVTWHYDIAARTRRAVPKATRAAVPGRRTT